MTIIREQVVKRFSRSNGWSMLRSIHLVKHDSCAVCGKKKGLEVHHIKPFYLHPELELDPSNLKTLCRRHHFAIGHLEYWKSYNPQIENSIIYFKSLLQGRP